MSRAAAFLGTLWPLARNATGYVFKQRHVEAVKAEHYGIYWSLFRRPEREQLALLGPLSVEGKARLAGLEMVGK